MGNESAPEKTSPGILDSTLRSCKISGIGDLLKKKSRELGKQDDAYAYFKVSGRTLRRIIKKEFVTEDFWNHLGSKTDLKEELQALCPEGWKDRHANCQRPAPVIGIPITLDVTGGIFPIGFELPGKRGPYWIVERLPAHSRTASFRAVDRLGKDYFIKTIAGEIKDATPRIKAKLKKLAERFQDERASFARLPEGTNIARVIDLDEITPLNFPYAIPFLVQDFIKGPTLSDHINNWSQQNGTPFSANDWFRIAKQLFETLRAVHSAGVVHGDVCPSNILFKEGTNDPVLVDFGQSFLLDVFFNKVSEGDYSNLSNYAAPERMKGGRWSRPADIYSMGAVLLYIASGKKPCPPETNNAKLKEFIFDTVKVIDQEEEGIGDIIFRCLRYSTEERATSADEILDLLRIFDNSSKAETFSVHTVRQEMAGIMKKVEKLIDPRQQVFLPLLLDEIRDLSRRVSEVYAGRVLCVQGDREQVLMGLLRYLSLLGPGDEYFTLTLPRFWTTDNLGVNGRFIRLNRKLAKRGVTIRRVFLLTQEEMKSPTMAEIVDAQIRAHEKLPCEINTTEWDMKKGGFYTGFCEISQNVHNDLIKHGHQVGVAKISGKLLTLIFKAKERDGQIRKVEFRKEQEDPDEILKDVMRYLPDSRPICDFRVLK